MDEKRREESFKKGMDFIKCSEFRNVEISTVTSGIRSFAILLSYKSCIFAAIEKLKFFFYLVLLLDLPQISSKWDRPEWESVEDSEYKQK